MADYVAGTTALSIPYAESFYSKTIFFANLIYCVVHY